MKKIFAFDLDGTLLNSNKEISEKTHKALLAAAEAGIVLVPSTGRFLLTLPDFIRDLPFVRYMILGNGSQIFDKEVNKPLFSLEIEKGVAERVFNLIKKYDDVLYDCYIGDKAYTERRFYENIDKYTSSPFTKDVFLRLRIPCEDFFSTIREIGEDENVPVNVQKISVYSKNHEAISKIKREIEGEFSNLVVTKSLPDNSEINAREATKGQAILKLADILSIDRKETIAIGDGTNDLDMIMMAGTGVAMGNAMPEVLEVADVITETNDEDGLANFLFRMLNIY